MAWLFVVQGASFTFESDDPYELKETISKDAKIVSLQERAEESGLILKSTCNNDDGELAFFVGKELMPERHIYKGVTFTGYEINEEERQQTRAIAAELQIALQAHGEVTAKEGIVLSQFD